jgi:WD40 repeat protein
MSWPLSQDYNEAIQSPATSFVDPELKKGEAICNALGIPMPCSGTFADVYEVHCPNGSRWAVKCFTREVPGLRERYQEISKALQAARLPFTVEFTYQQPGMRIRGRWFPILKMEWVEGLPLNEFLRQNLDKPAMLDSLLQIWARMAQYMRLAGIAHADLQHGNVLLVPGNTTNALAMKLIDYDGMFVPALARKPSGEVGHPAYQHPQRQRPGTWSAEVDRFPLLLIATALRCVRASGRALWERFDNGDNLLFRESDLKKPDGSLLFRELFALSSVRDMVGMVRRSLAGPFNKVPLLEEALPTLAAPMAVPVAPAPSPVAPAPFVAQASRLCEPATGETPMLQKAPVARVVPGPVTPMRTEMVKQAVAGTATQTVPATATLIRPDKAPERERPRTKASTRWVILSLALGLVLLVVGAGVYALGGRSNRGKPEEKQASRPPDKDSGTTPVKPTEQGTVVDPKNKPGPEPIRQPTPDPVTPVVPVADGVLRLRHVLPGRTPIRALAISEDGTLGLSADSEGTLRRWDLKAGVATREAPSGYSTVTGLGFLPGSRVFLFTANDGMAHLWDVERTDEENRLEKEWKWEPLFNGKDLTGWKIPPDNKTKWTVENGHLVGQGTDGLLVSERNDYTNFVYRIEAKLSDKGIAGQHFLIPPDNPATGGYEARINSNHANPERTGTLHGIAQVNEPLHKPDEWFTQEVTAIGSHIIIKVNGKVVVDVHDDKYRSGHFAFKQYGPTTVFTVRKIEIRELPEYVINDLDISSDARVALSACNNRVLGWNVQTSKHLPGQWPTLNSSSKVIRVAANGSYAISADASRRAILWDIATGTPRMMLGNPPQDPVRAVAISADGRLAATGTEDGRIQFHDPRMKWSDFRALPSLGVPIKALALSPDRRYIVAAGESPRHPFLVVFDLVSGKEAQRLEDVPVGPNLLKFAAYSTCLLAGDGEGRVRVFDLAESLALEVVSLPGVNLADGATVADNGGEVKTLSATRDGKVVNLRANGTLEIRDLGRLQVSATYDDPRKPADVMGVIRGNRALVATSTGSVHLVDLLTGKHQVVEDLADRVVRFVDLTEDGSLALICTHADNQDLIVIRDLSNNSVLRKTAAPPGYHMNIARFVPGSPHIVVGDNEHLLRLLNIRTGVEDRNILAGPGGVGGLVIAPDGKRAVSTGLDGAVRVWDLSNGNELYHFDSTPGFLPSAEVSADGQVGLAQFGTGANSFLLFWDLTTGRVLGSVPASATFRPRLSAFAGDSKHLVVVTTDGQLMVKIRN